ncbi:MAG: PEP-CTERM sorting domain-containing protein, partial [Spirulina sp.]
LDLTGWTLEEATAISSDGLSIVGIGVNPDGNEEAWLARLDSPSQVPEPSSTVAILTVVGTGLFATRKRKNAHN